jgi:L-2-hydroxyglutarate oxidase
MNSNDFKVDYLIIGGGILGLAIAKALKEKYSSSEILIIDKEPEICLHGSGRNSGVLHAGFYYTAETLKAKFCVDGNKALTKYCDDKQLPIAKIGKLVVATNESEVDGLIELEKRGKINGCDVSLISEEEAYKIEPNCRTFKKALWSPRTSTIDPIAICKSFEKELKEKGVRFLFNCSYLSQSENECLTSLGRIKAHKVINAAGLYADKIAKDFGFGSKYSILPFKGLYLKYTKNKTDIKTNIYPVPNLKHTFLGVHYTKTVDGTIKIGPTAAPAFWRENYDWKNNFNFQESKEIIALEAKLFLTNAFGFRNLAIDEIKKYSKKYLVGLAEKLSKNLDPKGFTEFSRPGIRAQLVEKQTSKLLMDFIIEGDNKSIHILNGISPGYTCSLPFADYVVDKYL